MTTAHSERRAYGVGDDVFYTLQAKQLIQKAIII